MNAFLRHEIVKNGKGITYERFINMPRPLTEGLDIVGHNFSFHVSDVMFNLDTAVYIGVDYTIFHSNDDPENYKNFIRKITREGFKKVKEKEIEE